MDIAGTPGVNGTAGIVVSLTMAAVSFFRMLIPEKWLPAGLLQAMAMVIGLGLTLAMAKASGAHWLQALMDGFINGIAATGLHQTTQMGVLTPDVAEGKK